MSRSSSASKINLESLDNLFGIKENTLENTQNIEINKLFSFHSHPFKVIDEQLTDIKDSIEEHGVLSPIIVRPKDDNTFEILVGHRRKRACELLELETIPCIIRDLSEEDSIITMVDSNIQREELLYSEKAFAYKMKLDAIKRRAGRPQNNCGQVVHNLKSREEVALLSDDSARQIQRFIRLTELTQDLLNLTDDKKLPFTTAVELSYLIKEEQTILFDKMEELRVTPTTAQAIKMKKYSSEETLAEAVIDSILSETTEKPVQVTFKKDKLTKYFSSEYTSEKIEEVIITLLEDWHKKQ